MHAREQTAPAPGRRDPEARRRAMLEAAAHLIVESGAEGLTHRAVAARAGVALGSTTQYFSSIDDLREAALQLLADEIDRDLVRLERSLEGPDVLVEEVTRQMFDFLSDARAVHAEIAIMSAGRTDPTRRALALRWFDRFVDIVARHLDRERAMAIAVYIDGATMYSGLHDTPLDKGHFDRAIRALISMPTEPRA